METLVPGECFAGAGALLASAGTVGRRSRDERRRAAPAARVTPAATAGGPRRTLSTAVGHTGRTRPALGVPAGKPGEAGVTPHAARSSHRVEEVS